MPRPLSVLLFLLIGTMLTAQPYECKWQYTWGGDQVDFLHAMIPLPGNQYFFGGTSASSISGSRKSTPYGDQDFVAMVFDDAGNQLWEKSYGGDNWDQLRTAIKVKSGGYLLVGLTESGISGNKKSKLYGLENCWVVRIDDKGNKLWDRTFGGSQIENGTNVLETPDGGFLIAGISLSGIPGYNNGASDYLLMKIDGSGNLLWQKTYGGVEFDDLSGLAATSDGNYFLCGSSWSSVSGNKTAAGLGKSDIWLIKVDPLGNKLWEKVFGTSGEDVGGSLTSLSDGNTLIIESTTNTGRLRKIDNNGNQLWTQSCSGNYKDFFDRATEDPATGNIYVLGSSETDNSGCKTSPYSGGGWFPDLWITIFDAVGNKLEDMDFGGNDADIPTDIDFVNNEIWVTSWSDSPLSGNKTVESYGNEPNADGWILRLAKKFYIDSKTPHAICASTPNSNVYIGSTSTFNTGNIFELQLSDSNGNFTHSLTIGSKTAIVADSIPVIVPVNLRTGQGYRIRVISSNPRDTTEPYLTGVYGLPVVNLGRDTVLCSNTNFILEAGSQPAGATYRWQDGSLKSKYFVTQPGVYWCTVQTTCGSVTDSVSVVEAYLPDINIGPDTGFCMGQSINLTANASSSGYTYQWNTGATTPAVSVTKGGMYWLQASNICGNQRDSVLVSTWALPNVVLDKTGVICKGSQHLLEAPPGYLLYLWNDGSSSPGISANMPGLYWVEVTDLQGCKQRDSTLITMVANPPLDFLSPADSVCPYEQLTIGASQSFSAYRWSTGASSRSVTLTGAGTYWLQVTDHNGCSGIDTIQVNTKECLTGFHIPTAFTPNNDGRNDWFRPVIGGTIKEYIFSIYNRWGQTIFTTTDPQKGWDGKLMGNALEAGVFVWTCRYRLDGRKSVQEKGTVMLIR